MKRIKIGSVFFITTKGLSLAVVSILFNLVLSTSILSQSQASYTVVIDAGHGGHDKGALGQHSYEKEIALQIALLAGEIVENNRQDIRVIYTRRSDMFLPLHDRIGLANEAEADLFVSVHCNSIKGVKARGSETYVMGLHSSPENLEVAKRENASIILEDDYQNQYDDYDPYSLEGHIILAAIQNSHLHQSIEVAEKVQKSMGINTPIRNRGVKQAGFLLLRKATMPSILVETGFLSDRKEEQYLMSDRGQRKISAGIAEGIMEYFELAPPPPQQLHAVSQSETIKVVTNPAPAQKEYAIQIASLSHPIDYADHPSFSELMDVREYQEDGLYKYRVGRYTDLATAIAAQQKLRSSGHKGAFVVVYQD